MLTVAGEDARWKCLTHSLSPYCTPKENITYERLVFNTRAQGATEGIDDYVTELRKLARNCEFGELHDSIIRDCIACERLLRKKDLNLERPVAEMYKSSEITENQGEYISLCRMTEKCTMWRTTPKSHPENREEQEESTSKQRDRSTVKDEDKCTNLRDAQAMVRFATNANKRIENVPVQAKGQL